MVAVADLFWTITTTRLTGVTAAGSRVLTVVPALVSWWIKPLMKGVENAMLAMFLVSFNHVDFAKLTLLAKELVVLKFKYFPRLALDDGGFLHLTFGNQPVSGRSPSDKRAKDVRQFDLRPKFRVCVRVLIQHS